eukprot:scaffold37542_cov146-Skeletonema_marinoi.AAC.5
MVNEKIKPSPQAIDLIPTLAYASTGAVVCVPSVVALGKLYIHIVTRQRQASGFVAVVGWMDGVRAW